MQSQKPPAPPLPWVNVPPIDVEGYGPTVLNLYATFATLNRTLASIQRFMTDTQVYLFWLTESLERTKEEQQILLAVEAAGIKEHILAYFALSGGERADLGV